LNGEELKLGLTTYRNRQVVVNRYEDDLLVSKDGYDFQELRMEQGHILFYKNQRIILDLVIDEAMSISKSAAFPNLYTFTTSVSRLEVYFP
jgi:hypothetical protein